VVRDIMLFGATPEVAHTSIMLNVLGHGFQQSIRMVADEMGFAIDPELRTTHEVAVATAPIGKSCMGGVCLAALGRGSRCFLLARPSWPEGAKFGATAGR